MADTTQLTPQLTYPISVSDLYKWMFDTSLHVLHIEYFLERLQIGSEDPQRPHDIIGTGNKFEWDIMKGLALQYKSDGEHIYKPQIDLALALHRQQIHHQQWNDPQDNVSLDMWRLGAVDTVCSLLEDRKYQGGRHSYAQIRRIANQNPECKAQLIDDIATEMQQIPPPPLHELTSLQHLPNIGISAEKYDILRSRVEETLQQLKEEYTFDLTKYHFSFERNYTPAPLTLGCR